MKVRQKTNTAGPHSYENWLAAKEGKPVIAASEFPFFTDAYVFGEIVSELGPYKILNTLPNRIQNKLAPSLIFRVEYHLEFDPRSNAMIGKTDTNRYHGGLLNDEVAALVSLCLGIRLKSGGCTRNFDSNKDPKGCPITAESYRDPILITQPRQVPVLPRASVDHLIESALILKNLPLISSVSANALIRAARLYQDAVWIAESEPQLSWIMLVSAVEVAASDWSTAKYPPTERLKASKPELFILLQNKGDEDLLAQIADQIADSLGSTKQFVDFILEFLPEPPEERPETAYQHQWDHKVMKESMRIIYKWRSRALHGGTPFPFPMCESPRKFQSAYSEKPLGLATYAQGASWVIKDTPMLLHTFEYIVRKALLKWWAASTAK